MKDPNHPAPSSGAGPPVWRTPAPPLFGFGRSSGAGWIRARLLLTPSSAQSPHPPTRVGAPARLPPVSKSNTPSPPFACQRPGGPRLSEFAHQNRGSAHAIPHRVPRRPADPRPPPGFNRSHGLGRTQLNRAGVSSNGSLFTPVSRFGVPAVNQCLTYLFRSLDAEWLDPPRPRDLYPGR